MLHLTAHAPIIIHYVAHTLPAVWHAAASLPGLHNMAGGPEILGYRRH